MNEWMNESMNEWTNDNISEWKNDWGITCSKKNTSEREKYKKERGQRKSNWTEAHEKGKSRKEKKEAKFVVTSHDGF